MAVSIHHYPWTYQTFPFLVFIIGRTVDGVEARLFDSPTCQYDIIFEHDFLKKQT